MAALLAALLFLVARPGLGQSVDIDSTVAVCVARDTASHWREVKARLAAGAERPGTDSVLRSRLLELGARDQSLRAVPAIIDSLQTSAAFRERLTAADSTNAQELRRIVAEHGWPTWSLVGAEAASAAWAVAQHNPDLEEWALRLIKALPPGEYSASDVATMEDRVRVHKGLPQLYGTQLSTNSAGALVYDTIEDLEHVDARRAELGMMPLSTYSCIMRGVYGREVLPPGR